jgi:haloalkane dehalogenase
VTIADTDQDLDVYRTPYPTPETRLPLLQWLRELPVDGEPADVIARVEAYDRWLASTPDVPKLLLTFDPGPGTMVSGPLVDWCKENIAGLDVQPCGLAGHHAPEDQPDCIGGALVAWIERHGLQFGVGVGS